MVVVKAPLAISAIPTTQGRIIHHPDPSVDEIEAGVPCVTVDEVGLITLTGRAFV